MDWETEKPPRDLRDVGEDHNVDAAPSLCVRPGLPGHSQGRAPHWPRMRSIRSEFVITKAHGSHTPCLWSRTTPISHRHLSAKWRVGGPANLTPTRVEVEMCSLQRDQRGIFASIWFRVATYGSASQCSIHWFSHADSIGERAAALPHRRFGASLRQTPHGPPDPDTF